MSDLDNSECCHKRCFKRRLCESSSDTLSVEDTKLCLLERDRIELNNNESQKFEDSAFNTEGDVASTLTKALGEVLKDENTACTPELLNMIANDNLLLVRIDEVLNLQHFAEKVVNKNLKFLKTRPFVLRPGGHPHSEDVEGVLRVHLDGAGSREGESVSLSISLKEKNREETSSLAVVFFLRDPNPTLRGEEVCLSRAFQMQSRSSLDEGEPVFRGILDFVSKEEFKRYVAKDGSVCFGLTVVNFGQYSSKVTEPELLQL